MTATKALPDSPTLPLDCLAEPPAPDLRLEKAYWRNGFRFVAGVDEAGRGPLAGPVVAAAVILDPARIPEGLDDSKKLTAAMRERLHGEIMETALAVGVSSLCAESIDATNILRASLVAMRRAVCALALPPDSALFDGRDIPPGLVLKAAPQAVIRGDGRSLSIAAASIVAKVTRDRMMMRLAPCHADYGMDSHKGYGAKAHRDAITRFGGVIRLHRFTFAPLK